jgi:DNA invertase Pin-like site-specific DNA recombinase
MKKAIGYVRVSTEEQAEEGVSLRGQAEKIRQYAALHDLDLVEIIEDAGRSAKDLRRPGMARALEMVKKGEVSTMIVAKLDRATRSVRDLQDLLTAFAKKGAEFASVAERLDTSSASGRFFVGMLGLVAQWERETISERTRDGLAKIRSEGRRVSGEAPRGFRFKGDLVVVDPVEKRLVAQVAAMRRKGLSIRKIADALNERGLRTRGGGRFYASGVERLLRAA